MAGGNHHSALTVEMPYSEVEDRRRADPDIDYIHTGLEHPSHEQIAIPVRSQTAVSSHHDPPFTLPGHVCSEGPAKRRNILICNFGLGNSAYVVFSKDLWKHDFLLDERVLVKNRDEFGRENKKRRSG
jgi:hypothetical protein